MQPFYDQIHYTFAEGILLSMSSTRSLIHALHVKQFHMYQDRNSVKFDCDVCPYVKLAACKRRISRWCFAALRLELSRLEALVESTQSLPKDISSIIFTYMGRPKMMRMRRYNRIASRMTLRRSDLTTYLAFKRLMKFEGTDVVHRNRFILRLGHPS